MRKQKLLQITVLPAIIALAAVVLPERIPQEQAAAKTHIAHSHAVAGVSVPAKIAKKRPYLVSNSSQPSTLLAAVNKPDIEPHHRMLADTVLRALPPHCRTHLKNFYVQYDKPDQRGLGGATTIILYGGVGDEEFIGLLIHECGHVTHSHLIGSPESGASSFKDGSQIIYNDGAITAFFKISWSDENTKKKTTKDKDFVSGYARSNPFEDFAETLTFYALHRDAFEDQAKKNKAIAAKFAWMERHLPMNDDVFINSSHEWTGTIPWDSTRLPGTLTAAVVIP